MSQPPAPVSPKLATLHTLAITLLIVAIIDLLAITSFIVYRSIQVATGNVQIPPGLLSQNLQTGFYLGFYAPLFAGILAIPLLLLLIRTTIAMLRLSSLRAARAAAILAILPFTASCCCLTTLPLGIWTLVLLNSPEVQAAFAPTTDP